MRESHPPPPVSRDLAHLRWLAVLHYLAGGLIVLVTALRILIGIWAVRTGPPLLIHGHDEPVPLHMVLVPLATFIFITCVIAGCEIAAGRLLRRRHGYRFIFTVACLNCLGFPLVTVLGIFTLIVLLRPSVKQLFGGNVKL